MPSRRFSNQKKKQVLSHLRAHMDRKVKYYISSGEDYVRIVEARARKRKKADFKKMLEIVGDRLHDEDRYDMEIGSFKASCEIKTRSQKGRSKKGHDKKKLDKWRNNLKGSDVKKYATKKTTKPKIRSQKGGRRMVTLKGQPGCGN